MREKCAHWRGGRVVGILNWRLAGEQRDGGMKPSRREKRSVVVAKTYYGFVFMEDIFQVEAFFAGLSYGLGFGSIHVGSLRFLPLLVPVSLRDIGARLGYFLMNT